jgi:hypothetical protein
MVLDEYGRCARCVKLRFLKADALRDRASHLVEQARDRPKRCVGWITLGKQGVRIQARDFYVNCFKIS